MSEFESIKTVTQPTAMQVGLLVENDLTDVRGINIVQKIFSINQQFRRALFTSAWSSVIGEFDVLRMSLQRSPRSVFEARFQPAADFDCEFTDLSRMTASDAEETFRQIIQNRRISGIDFAVAPAMRVDCFQFSSSHWRFLWTYHHSLLEGFSAVSYTHLTLPTILLV